jgi:hypothetical protein
MISLEIVFLKKKIEKRSIVKDKSDQPDAKRTRTKWITDYLIIFEFTKIVVGTG